MLVYDDEESSNDDVDYDDEESSNDDVDYDDTMQYLHQASKAVVVLLGKKMYKYSNSIFNFQNWGKISLIYLSKFDSFNYI